MQKTNALRFSKLSSVCRFSIKGCRHGFFLAAVAVFCFVSIAAGQSNKKQIKQAQKLMAQGEQCAAKKDYQCALARFDEAARLAPDLAAAYEAKGRMLEALSKEDEATLAYIEALRRNYNKPAALYSRACFYYLKKEQNGEAVEVCRKAAAAPENASAAYVNYSFLSLAHERLNQYNEALEAVNQSLKLKPDEPSLHGAKARLLVALNQPAEALEVINQAIKLKADDQFYHSMKGNILSKLGRSKEAVAAFIEQTKVAPKSDLAFLNLGMAYLSTKEYDKAKNAFIRSSQLNPSSQAAWGQIALTASYTQDWQTMLNASQYAISLKPDDAMSHFWIGFAHAGLGQSPEAINALEQALKNQFPKKSLLYYFIALENRKLSKTAAAEAAFQQILQIKPEDKIDHSMIGLTHRYYGRWNDAIKMERKSIILSDDDDDAAEYRALGWLYSISGQHEAAIAAATETIEREPKNARAYTTRCRAQNDLRLFEQAIADCQKALELDPNDGETLYYIGRNYRLQKNVRKADEFNRKAIAALREEVKKDFYKQGTGYYVLGNALVDDNQFNEAIKAYQQSIVPMPKFAFARLNLGFAYVKHNDKQGAVTQYQELAKIDLSKAEQLMSYIRNCRTCR